jgi:hypothetical protein
MRKQSGGLPREPQVIPGGAEKFRSSVTYKNLKVLVPTIDEALQANGAIIAGGSVLRAIAPPSPDDPFGELNWKSNDVDIYVPIPNDKAFKALFPNDYDYSNHRKSSNYCRSFLRRNGIRYVNSMNYNSSIFPTRYGQPIDIMAVRKRTTPLAVVQNFDLTFCQVWYDGKEVYATHPDHIAEKSGELQGDYVPIYFTGNRFLRTRIRKYLKRGFKVRADKNGKDTTKRIFDDFANVCLTKPTTRHSRCATSYEIRYEEGETGEKGLNWARKTLFRACMKPRDYESLDVYLKEEDGYDSEDYVEKPEKLIELAGSKQELASRSNEYLSEIKIYFEDLCDRLPGEFEDRFQEEYMNPLLDEIRTLCGEEYRRSYAAPSFKLCDRNRHENSNNNNNYNNNYPNYNNNNNNNNNSKEDDENNNANNATRALNTRPMYVPPEGQSQPAECFDPYMASTVDIGENQILFYIFNKPAAANSSPSLAKVACFDADDEMEVGGRTIPVYKKFLEDKSYLYFRCKPTVPRGAIFVSRAQVEPEPLRRLAFEFNVYVPAWQAKKVQAGRKYALIPTEQAVGRIVSDDLLRRGNAVSAEHCQTEYTDKVYSIYEMVTSGGGRIGFRKITQLQQQQQQQQQRRATRKGRKSRQTRKGHRQTRRH